MNKPDLNSRRARKARAAALIGVNGQRLLLVLAALGAVASAVALAYSYTRRDGFGGLALSLLIFMVGVWYRLDLNNLPPHTPMRSLDDIMEASLLAKFRKGQVVTPQSAWQVACGQWQGRFVVARLLLDARVISQGLSNEPSEMDKVWQTAQDLATKQNTVELNSGTLVSALLITSEAAKKYLSVINLNDKDVIETFGWLERLNQHIKQPSPYFGGVGRDWATGFTPMLDRFGQNISRAVETGEGHYHTLAHEDILDSVVHNLEQGSGALALVGEAGTGKTALTYALAERLLEGRDSKLRYYQIVSLNASQILSVAGDKLEKIMLTLFGEAVHAQNIIIFLDEARLFFGKGVGAFDMSQILMPLIQNRTVKIISAFTPNDYQNLKTTNETLAADMAVVTVTEPPAGTVMKILEDTALTLEQRDNIMVSYGAIRDAYRLSSQYFQDRAYPGKAINLLEQATPYVENEIMTAKSVQSTVEKTLGVKVSKADIPEADLLLHLEDRIHERMINQTRAVSAVAAALRRNRAGVASPNRPVGSFLFLGPTGVGKTELARSLAATYFGDEHRMIRLDMSEYQQAEDAGRLLQGGQNSSKSLIMSIREQPFSVVLLDEIEKAHPNILNLLLQLLDEGQLTDQNGKPASFKNAIIISTSNAGSIEISKQVEDNQSLDNFERTLIDELISRGTFRPELVNRFDEVVLFRPLNQDELAQVAKLMLEEVNKTLAKQSISVNLTDAALAKIVLAGYDPEFGARPMRRAIQEMVEDPVAARILSGQAQPGSAVTLDVNDLLPLNQ
jgi:ATP-dependent Clp protease ATP-binding subunit ClpA